MNTQARCRSIEDLPLVLTIEDLMSVLDIGRNSAYRLIRENQIRSIRIGTIAIQEIIKEYQRQKTNQRSRKGGSARKPQQYHAEAEVII